MLVKRDYAEAAALYRQAALRGDLMAMANLGNVLVDHLEDPLEAEYWYAQAIDAGDAAAAEWLAILRLDQGRTQEALRWL